MVRNPWWEPTEADLGWDDEPLSPIVNLSPAEYGAELPLWGDMGYIAWQFTKFSPQLLDRLAAWQQDFEDGFDNEAGWRSVEQREHWARDADDLAAGCRRS
jgi:hypothetical protein